MKKKLIYSLIYFFILFVIGAILTQNEYLTTALIINFWFSIPMTICFFMELIFLKNNSNAIYALIAIINTVILFIILCAFGIFVLGKYMYIPF